MYMPAVTRARLVGVHDELVYARPCTVWAWLGGYTGWVIGGLYRYPDPRVRLLEERYMYSEAGPVGPAGAGVGGTCSSDVRTRVRSPQTTHSRDKSLPGPAPLSEAC